MGYRFVSIVATGVALSLPTPASSNSRFETGTPAKLESFGSLDFSVIIPEFVTLRVKGNTLRNRDQAEAEFLLKVDREDFFRATGNGGTIAEAPIYPDRREVQSEDTSAIAAEGDDRRRVIAVP